MSGSAAKCMPSHVQVGLDKAPASGTFVCRDPGRDGCEPKSGTDAATTTGEVGSELGVSHFSSGTA